MLSESAFLRVILLLVAAAVLAGVVQHYFAQSGESADPPRTEAARPNAGTRVPVREISAAPQPSAPVRPAPESAPSETVQAATAPAAPQDASPEPSPQEPAQDQALAQPPDASTPDADEAARSEPTAATDEGGDARIDLNTGTLAQLNGLKGGGAIGRAIIQRRPYSSVEQLLTKRVLNRSTFQRIKDQVTVR